MDNETKAAIKVIASALYYLSLCNPALTQEQEEALRRLQELARRLHEVAP